MEIQELAAQGENAACQMSAWADRASVSSEWFRQKLDTFAKLDSQLRRPAVEFPEIASILEFFFQEQRRPGATEVIPLTRELAQSYGGLATMAATFQKAVQELATLLASWWGKELFPEVAQEMHSKSGRSEELPPKNGVTPCW
jgi:hypothetical protein